jgi:hypothetical protein
MRDGAEEEEDDGDDNGVGVAAMTATTAAPATTATPAATSAAVVVPAMPTVLLAPAAAAVSNDAVTAAPAVGPRSKIAKSLGLEDYNNDGANQPRNAVERSSALDASLVGDRELRRGIGLASSKSLPGGGERIYGRYTHNYHRLYLVVHSIDADMLRSGDFQRCLATLAACPCVAMVASMDHLNTPLLWDTEMLARFRWSYQHAPTFECNGIRDSELFSSIKGKNGGGRALQFIMQSLTTKHRDIISHLARLELDRRTRVATASTARAGLGQATAAVRAVPGVQRQASDKGVSLAALLDVCTAKLIVRNEQDLRYHLKEPMDHKILSIAAPDADSGAIYISLYLPVEILETLIA